ncbi:MAG: FAD-dependent oxidoreductase [Lachnospiraceae bacterium]|nr:FAD-dependent oxidoreductase [Lachnospiraceae bacterium]
MPLPDKDLKNFYDVVIIGGGPAGLTAALYLARACFRVVVVEKQATGGTVAIVAEIVNYPGMDAISGTDLINQMHNHAASFGAEFLEGEVTALLDTNANIKTVRTTAGTLQCYGILIATGARPKLMGFIGERNFRGRGISYNAVNDGEFFTGKEIFVIGSGTTAARESVFLTKYASHVTVLSPGDYSCDRMFWTNAEKHPQIKICKNVTVKEVSGDSLIRSITWTDNADGTEHTYAPESGDTFGVFVLTGYDPSTSLVKGLVDLDELDYVLVDRAYRTSAAGIYAAGDVCSYAFRQALTAASSGAIAATDLAHFVLRLQREIGIVPEQPARRSSLHKTIDAGTDENYDENKSLFSPDMLSQLNTVFMMMERPLVMHLYPDSGKVSNELVSYMHSLAALAPMLRVNSVQPTNDEPEERPYVHVTYEDGGDTGIRFHGMPGGNEFNSFVLGLYNASCQGQKISDEARKKIKAIDHDVHITIFVTLTCSMCPDLVTAAQRIATLSDYVTTDVYDLNHFPDKREKWNIMSVPCFYINDGPLKFGHKTVEQLLELI